MWASSISATTSSATVLAYLVTMSSSSCKNSLMTSTCLITKPSSNSKIPLVDPHSPWMAPPVCKEGIRIYGLCCFILCILRVFLSWRLSWVSLHTIIWLGFSWGMHEFILRVVSIAAGQGVLLNDVGCSYQLSLVNPHMEIVVSVDDRHAEATVISRANRNFPIIISDLN